MLVSTSARIYYKDDLCLVFCYHDYLPDAVIMVILVAMQMVMVRMGIIRMMTMMMMMRRMMDDGDDDDDGSEYHRL